MGSSEYERLNNVVVGRRCSTCKDMVPLIFFYPNKHSKYGVASVCKSCYLTKRYNSKQSRFHYDLLVNSTCKKFIKKYKIGKLKSGTISEFKYNIKGVDIDELYYTLKYLIDSNYNEMMITDESSKRYQSAKESHDKYVEKLKTIDYG